MWRRDGLRAANNSGVSIELSWRRRTWIASTLDPISWPIPRAVSSTVRLAAVGGLIFRVELDPGASWHTCLYWMPDIEGRDPSRSRRPCHQLLDGDLVDLSRPTMAEVIFGHHDSQVPATN